MIGHFLLTLSPEQEDRVLTGKMAGYLVIIPDNFAQIGGCLLQTVDGERQGERKAREDYVHLGVTGCRGRHLRDHVGQCYDRLCDRFGPDRIHAAIRNRILTNQARRTLVREAVPV